MLEAPSILPSSSSSSQGNDLVDTEQDIEIDNDNDTLVESTAPDNIPQDNVGKDLASSTTMAAPSSISTDSNAMQVDNDQDKYMDLLSKRKDLFEFKKPIPPQHYTMSCLLNLPHASPVNALTLPPCFSHIFTGSQDGFIRRYGFHSSLAATLGGNYESNPKERDLNLMMKQGGHAAGLVTGVLVGYWENSDTDKLETLDVPTRVARAKWAPRSLTGIENPSPVHSLAVESQEIWGLSGSENGFINLFTIRHDEGQIRHVFSPVANSPNSHVAGNPISVLMNHPDEKSFLSGGWDSKIIHWDLNTGQPIRTFKGHTTQLTSLSWRPAKTPKTTAATADGTTTKESNNNDEQQPSSRPTSSGGLLGRSSGKASPAPSTNSFDPLFDENSSSESTPNSPKSKTDSTVAASLVPSKEPMLPEASDFDSDVFLSTSIDGQARVWDRRVQPSENSQILKLDPDMSDPKHSRGRNWCASGIFTPSGNKILLGRRNSSVDVYDVRKTGTSVVETLTLPSSCGPVSCLAPLADDRHVLVGAQDNIRIWDLEQKSTKKNVPFRIVPGSGGTISQLVVDPSETFAVAASGGRGWIDGKSTDSVTIIDIKRSAI